MRDWLIAMAVLLAVTGCVAPRDQSEGATQTATSPSESSANGTVSVVVKLPQDNHSMPIDGWVVDSTGARVAEYRFEAAVLYERGGEGYGGGDYDATITGAPLQLSVQVPGPGVYQFHVGAVEYFGGCGTCGRFHQDGGSVAVSVVDGSVVRLDIGPMTGQS